MYQLVTDENNDDELLEAVDDYEQRDALNPPYTEGAAMEEANPDRYITPPIIRPATRPDQLRLYMDELSPLTTEDYTDQPPTLQESTVILHAVTHTEIGPIHNEMNCFIQLRYS